MAALERCATVGLETGANIVVSRRNVNEVGRLAVRVHKLGAERFVPTYVPAWSPLNAFYETLRPEPEDGGRPAAGRVDVNWGYAWFWADPEAYTEGVCTRAALRPSASKDDAEDQAARQERELPLLVDANMDVFVGTPSVPPLKYVANLRRDEPIDVYAKLVALEWPSAAPPDGDLARRYGDTESRKLHIDASSVRRKWIAAWRTERKVPWLASY